MGQSLGWGHLNFGGESGLIGTKEAQEWGIRGEFRERACERWGGWKVLEGVVRMVFYGLLEEDLDAFCPVSEGWKLGNRGFTNVVFHLFIAF